jgi:MFS transporter, ACS family, hexuronate transporter
MLRWGIVSLLFFATVINYLDRQALSLLAPVLRDTFGISNTDYSRIIFAFLLAYMIMQAGSGRMMDWLGTRKGFSITIVFWSIAAMLHAAANSALFFGFSRFLLGLGEAGNWPGAVKAISEWFPVRERAAAIGFFNSGSIVGALIAPLIIPWVALQFGWRAAFLVTGACGFLWLIPWLLIYRLPHQHPWISASELELIREPESAGGDERTPPVRWQSLLKRRDVWSLVFGRMFADPVWWFYVFWLPEYLKRERGFSMEMIAYFAWIPFLTAGIGSLVGGAASGWLIRRGWPVLRARKATMLFCTGGMLAGIPAVLTGNSFLALAMISTVTFAYSAWASNILALPADIYEKTIVATASGISGTGAALGGMAFTLATGFAVDHFSYVPIFFAAALMPFAAISILHWGIRKRLAYEPVHA